MGAHPFSGTLSWRGGIQLSWHTPQVGRMASSIFNSQRF